MKNAESLDRLERFIARGEAFRKDFDEAYFLRWYRYSDFSAGFSLWREGALREAAAVLGPDSSFLAGVVSSLKRFAGRAPVTAFSLVMSALSKALEEARRGRQEAGGAAAKAGFTAEMLFRAEEMAGKGNHCGAIILGGAVLDDSLRALCSRSGLFCAENAALLAINDRLMQRGVYGAGDHAAAARFMHLKEKAGRSGGESVSAAEAGRLLSWLKDFCGKNVFSPGAACPIP